MNLELDTQDVNEERHLAQVKRPDATPALLEKIAKDKATSRSRKIKLALIEHPHTPRHVSLSCLRNLYTFDLMTVALMPGVAADIKIAAEEALINRLDKLSIGEKLSLARRASTRVVAALLDESDSRVVSAALNSARVTEIILANALVRRESSELLDQSVRRHAKWSARPEIQQALLRRTEHFPD